MKKTSLSLLAVAAVLAATPAFADTTPGWYTGVGAGLNITPDLTSRTAAGDSKVEFKPNFDFDVNGGYAFNFGGRLEGEYFHNQANVNKVEGSSTNTGHLTNNDLFLNGLYDFKTGEMVTPYVGAGIGLDFAHARDIGTVANGGALDDTRTKFAYQGIAGVAAQLDHNWAVTADYRYIASLKPKYNTTVGGSASTDNASHNVMVGLRYSYDTPVAPVPMEKTVAPMPVAKPVAKPMVNTVAQSYMVFFDFDKSELTPEAKRIIASAAQAFRNGKYVDIVVT
ncbi:MAG: outer membrane beta-barrel protein, partial [Alphaproteobacteria bacterium]|nr:outer membrane beta-barrel protein [Alphaproteobacteria bacterium]